MVLGASVSLRLAETRSEGMATERFHLEPTRYRTLTGRWRCGAAGIAANANATHLARIWVELKGSLAEGCLSGPARPYWLGLISFFPALEKTRKNQIDRVCGFVVYSLRETASSLSDFFFLFHFHGLSSFPIENLLFLSSGGVLVPLPRLFVLNAEPFCFFAGKEKTG